MTNKVIWSEGMLLRQQQFQQQEYYVEWLAQQYYLKTQPYYWGVTELKYNAQHLGSRRFNLECASGIFPDGTPFEFPGMTSLLNFIEIPVGASNVLIYLALPLANKTVPLANLQQPTDKISRYQAEVVMLKDAYSSNVNDSAEIQLAKLNVRLLLETDDRSQFSCVAVARVKSCEAETGITLDEEFIPPCLNSSQQPKLANFILELQQLLEQRINSLASRLSLPGRGSVADVTEFLMLQVLNRYYPLFCHLSTQSLLHPHQLYQYALQLLGDLSTYTQLQHTCTTWPEYQHHNLQITFMTLWQQLRLALTAVLEQSAVAIPLGKQNQLYLAHIADTGLFTQATFVLAVKADVPHTELQKRLPVQIKIGTNETIQALISSQVPGIRLQELPVAPPQIPYHAGFHYFALNQQHELWQQLQATGNLAIHMSGQFPNLELSLWAIRSQYA